MFIHIRDRGWIMEPVDWWDKQEILHKFSHQPTKNVGNVFWAIFCSINGIQLCLYLAQNTMVKIKWCFKMASDCNKVSGYNVIETLILSINCKYIVIHAILRIFAILLFWLFIWKSFLWFTIGLDSGASHEPTYFCKISKKCDS